MSTFPILFLYKPEDKRNKKVISKELYSSYEEQAINSFFFKKSLQEFMWMAAAKRGDRYNWSLHSTLQPSFKLLEVIKIK